MGGRSSSQLPPPPAGREGWPWTAGACRSAFAVRDGAVLPRISIVTPSFNQAQYLEETIRSVLLQGYPNLEYIIVDGGSTDGSIEIIRKYEPWLTHWESEPDRGQAHAINKGFARAHGELITFQNSDDYYLPGALLHAADLFAGNPSAGLVVGSFRSIGVDGSQSDVTGPVYPWKTPVDLRLVPPGAWRLHQVSALFARDVLDQAGRHLREDLRFALDRELLFRVVRLAPPILADRCYAHFRLHDASKSVSAGLPFAEEMASLYWDGVDPSACKRRRASWRAVMAGGHLRSARLAGRRGLAARHLVSAAILRPDCLLTRDFMRRVARATLGTRSDF